MLKNTTLFIVGAGASAEFRLPTGDALSGQISSLLNMRFDWERQVSGDRQIHRLLQATNDVDAHVKACWRIVDALEHHNSIDNVVDNHSDNERIPFCAKLAISHAILGAERASALSIDDSNIHNDISFSSVRDCWLPVLFRMMQEGIRLPDLDKFFHRAGFLVFNYDRCIEHYFLRALPKAYGISLGDAAEVLKAANIHHVYGTVGKLPYLSEGQSPVGFGDTRADLLQSSSNLRTYSEGVALREDWGTIVSLVQQATSIVFVGFGYGRTNMDLLRQIPTPSARLVLGSTYGMSEFNAAVLRKEIAEWTGHVPTPEQFPPNKAADFLQNIGRALA